MQCLGSCLEREVGLGYPLGHEYPAIQVEGFPDN